MDVVGCAPSRETCTKENCQATREAWAVAGFASYDMTVTVERLIQRSHLIQSLTTRQCILPETEVIQGTWSLSALAQFEYVR